MFKSYLRSALRHLWEYRLYTGINIFGLGIGLAVSLLLLFYVANELSYDTFHTNAEDIYRIYKDENLMGEGGLSAQIPAPALGRIAAELPEVKHATKVQVNNYAVYAQNNDAQHAQIAYGDSAFFKVFDFKIAETASNEHLTAPNGAYITKEMAEKVFGTTDVLHESLTIIIDDTKTEFHIAGLLENIPANSHFRFDILIPIENLQDRIFLTETDKETGEIKQRPFSMVYSYVLLYPGTDIDQLSRKLQKQFINPEGKWVPEDGVFFLQALTDIHLYSNLKFDFPGNSEIRYILIFSSIGLLILLISNFNFLSLSLVGYLKRMKEVGVRKVLGAGSRDILRQFMIENIIQTISALGIAILAAELLIGYFNSLVQRELSLSIAETPFIFVAILSLAALTGIFTGLYATWFYTRFKSVNLIQGQMNKINIRTGSRRVLIVTQFVMASFLIGCMLIISQQMNYIQSKDLGFDSDGIVVIHTLGLYENTNPFISELKRTHAVELVSNAMWVPAITPRMPASSARYNDKIVRITHLSIDKNFIPALGFTMKEGENFSENRPEGYILNEAARTILDEVIKDGYINRPDWRIEGPVTGVVKNFHAQSLKMAIEPIIFHPKEVLEPGVGEIQGANMYSQTGYIIVKVKPQRVREALLAAESLWKEMAPAFPFNYEFLDEALTAQYQNETRIFSAVTSASLVAVIIACLGIFAVASFLIQQRTKEVGIRKVLGASVPHLNFLLTKEFLIIVAIANLLAVPAVYYIMELWLQDFVYRIEVEWYVFIGVAVLSVGIAWVTLSFQSLRAALANPVNTLRYE